MKRVQQPAYFCATWENWGRRSGQKIEGAETQNTSGSHHLQRLWKKGHYAGNNEYPTQASLKEDAKSISKIEQENSCSNDFGGGDHKVLVKIKDASCSPMMGYHT